MTSTISVTGSTVVSTNKVAATLEAAYRLQLTEDTLEINPNNVTITINDDTKIIALAGTIPLTVSFDTDGDLIITATDYTSAAITPGGDIKATNVSSLLLEMLQKMVDAEDAKAITTPTFDAVTTLTLDTNAQRANFSTTIPFTTTLVSGKPTLTAVDFL